MKPILITVGDPAGVGAEVALKALRKGAANDRPVALVGPPSVWRRAAELIGAGDEWPIWADTEPFVFGDDPADPGDARLAERGRALVRAIDAAVRPAWPAARRRWSRMPIDKRALPRRRRRVSGPHGIHRRPLRRRAAGDDALRD